MPLPPSPIREIVQPRVWHGPAMPITKYHGAYFASKDTYDLIWSSIVMILGTRLGTVVMEPTFGSLLPELLFEPNDAALVALAQRYVVDALIRWEPRITVLKATITPREDELQIMITYCRKGEAKSAAMTRGFTVKRNTDFQILMQFYNG